MSNGYRNRAFALGLVVGGVIVFLVFLFGQKVYDFAKCYHEAQCERSAEKYEGKDFPSWWWWDWTGSLVTSDDTLAQWIMSFFTIAAVLLVWRTLVSTQNMARETTRIGEAQVMAHLMPVDLLASLERFDSAQGETAHFSADFKIKNTGSTPAYRISVSAVVDGFGGREWTSAVPRDIGPNGEAMAKIYSNIDPGRLEDKALGYKMSIYINFDTVFTRAGDTAKQIRVRFDYIIKRNLDGTHKAKRL